MTKTSSPQPEAPPVPMPMLWKPDRATARARLQYFLPRAGSTYARRRNYDFGPDNRRHVSALSPWLRHRLLLEDDVLRVVLSQHSMNAAEKFIQEVFWRGYFKGWLEHHPDVWRRYCFAVRDQIGQLETDAGLERRYNAAISGNTGIACFAAWARELTESGYLHNHARMWFASIWIFTLQLPWVLGADFFYRHLLDGDPASNTCSWRWVGGLHTKGKTYLARAGNIARYTEGRFCPEGQLSSNAPALEEPALPAPKIRKPIEAELTGYARFGLLIMEEDCSPESLDLNASPSSILVLSASTARSLLPMGDKASHFASDAMNDVAKGAAQHFPCDVVISDATDWQMVIKDWAGANKLDAIATSRLPIGPVSRRVMMAVSAGNIPLFEITRSYDAAVWPHAKRGFFGLKKKLPEVLRSLDITS